MPSYVVAPVEVRAIFERVIKAFPDKFSHIPFEDVAILVREGDHPRDCARTVAISPPFSCVTHFKYIIFIIEERFANLSDAQKHLLIYHELKHIPKDLKACERHDLEDFADIVKKFGVDWVSEDISDILEGK